MPVYNSKQEIFDKVWNTFVVEKAPQAMESRTEDNPFVGCRYCLPGTKGCAIGCLLTEADAFRADAESGKGVLKDIPEDIFQKYFNNEDFLLLEALQEIHDGWMSECNSIGFNDYMMVELENVAEDFGLMVPTA